MIELAFTFSIAILMLYTNKKGLKPSEIYIGTEEEMVEYVKKVIYYNSLTSVISYIFPIIIALSSVISPFKKFWEVKSNNICIIFVLTLFITAATIVTLKIYTKCKLKKVKRNNEFHKYLDNAYIDTSL